MTRQLQVNLSLLLIVLTVVTGCHPTQPFYFHEDGDLSHYLDRATDLEYPDVDQPRLAEVDFAERPLTLSDPEPREMWDLTLEEAISIALKNTKSTRVLEPNSFQSQIPVGIASLTRNGRSNTVQDGAATVYDPAIRESDPQSGVEAALSAFDAQINILGTNNGNFVNTTDRPSTFAAGTLVQQTAGGMRSELSKRAANGTQFSVRNITEYTRGNTIFGFAQPVRSIWQTTMEVEVRQPILQDRGTMINRIPVLIGRINTDVSLASFEVGIRDMLLDVEQAYWDLQLAYRFLETTKIARDWSQRTWKTVYEKQRGGVSGIQEEQQSRDLYFQARSAVEIALADLYRSEAGLRYLLGLTPNDGRLIRPIDEPSTAQLDFDWYQIHEEAQMRSAEVRQQKWVIQRRELELLAARNQLLPQFDLGATYRWFGMGDDLINAERNGLNFPTAGSTAADELTEGDYQEAAFFMQFQMPVGFRRALSGVRNAELQIARERTVLEDMELAVTHRLTSSIRDLDLHRKLFQTYFMQWQAASDQVETGMSLLAGGKITLDVVLDAQRRRTAAQGDYYRAVINYNKAIAELHRRKGSLLEYDNVQLAEGPWPDKAYWDAHGLARERDASYYLDYGWTRPRVISQGPVPQQMGDISAETLNEGADGNFWEPTPAGEPTPSDPNSQPPALEAPVPATPEKESPRALEGGPITSRPESPSLNAPLIRASAVEPLRDNKSRVSQGVFNWGGLRNDTVVPAGGNPLRGEK